MELRIVDPRKLKSNPNNPRRTKASPEADAQLTANIKAVGVIQPPRVKEVGKKLEVIAGDRRVRCAIAAGLDEIHVLVSTEDDGADPLRSLAENVQRAQLGPVDQWRAIEALCGTGWSEEAIAAAFSFTVRTIRKLRLLARIHPAMLDRMTIDLPRENELRTISAAALEEQGSVWRKHKPKRGEQVAWHEIARLLHGDRMPARIARFDDETAAAFGILYEEDLFAPAGEDSRSTAQVDAFFAAQRQWLEANLPENGTILETESWGAGKLPPRAERCYGEKRDGDRIGFFIDPRTAEVREIPFRFAEPVRSDPRGGDDESGTEGSLRTTRPEVSRKGVERIGDLRTDALHTALREAAFDDSTLLGMLVLAFGGSNVSVHGAGGGRGDRGAIARRLIHGGTLTSDLALLRTAGREMLVQVLSCREGMSRSGMVARIAGEAIGADRFLANMATDGFLKCLSKAGIERAATEEAVPVLPKTGKEIRAALIAHVGEGTYVLPAARFALSPVEVEELQERIAADEAGPFADAPLDDAEAGAERGADEADADDLGGTAAEEDDPSDGEDLPPPWSPDLPQQPEA
ncbi:MAG: ParB N-terminal domain-containing protein [Rhodospirillales bacterium]|nr:ParB N-terminal domain-containing protein [Rhodospirillales bacterium]